MLREAVLFLQRQDNPRLVEVGRSLGAAFGALALAKNGPEGERPLRLGQADALLARAVKAWLGFLASGEAHDLPDGLAAAVESALR
jgi:hypothetical protein